MPATPTVEQRRAAHLVAERIEAMLLEMLLENQYGEVAVIRHPDRPHKLKPVKRMETEAPEVTVERAGNALIRGTA